MENSEWLRDKETVDCASILIELHQGSGQTMSPFIASPDGTAACITSGASLEASSSSGTSEKAERNSVVMSPDLDGVEMIHFEDMNDDTVNTIISDCGIHTDLGISESDESVGFKTPWLPERGEMDSDVSLLPDLIIAAGVSEHLMSYNVIGVDKDSDNVLNEYLAPLSTSNAGTDGTNIEENDGIQEAKDIVRKLRNRDHAKKSRERASFKQLRLTEENDKLIATQQKLVHDISQKKDVLNYLQSWTNHHHCQGQGHEERESDVDDQVTTESSKEISDTKNHRFRSIRYVGDTFKGLARRRISLRPAADEKGTEREITKCQLVVKRYNIMDFIKQSTNIGDLEKGYEKLLSPWDVRSEVSSNGVVRKKGEYSSKWSGNVSRPGGARSISVLKMVGQSFIRSDCR